MKMKLYKHWLGVLCGLILMGMASCSGDGEEVVDDGMSQETTPVTFALGKDWSYVLFDYTDGGTYIGSDTIHLSKQAQEAVKLRQGKHQLLWVKGLTTEPYDPDYRFFSSGVHFMRESNTFFAHMWTEKNEETGQTEYELLRNPVLFWKKSLEVSPYLLPVQEPDYVAVTGELQVYFTDEYIPKPDFSFDATFTNIPVVSEVSMEGKQYTLLDMAVCKDVSLYYIGTEDAGRVPDFRFTSLCPLDGLNDIQLVVSSTNSGGQTVVTLQLPKCSIRRGYVTRLVGPLFGNANEWTMIESPYMGYD